MKFYEFDSPYYALLKASNEEEAKVRYVRHVAEDEGDLEFKEVSEGYALVKYSRATGEDKKVIPIEQILEEFYYDDCETLIVDGQLI